MNHDVRNVKNAAAEGYSKERTSANLTNHDQSQRPGQGQNQPQRPGQGQGGQPRPGENPREKNPNEKNR